MWSRGNCQCNILKDQVRCIPPFFAGLLIPVLIVLKIVSDAVFSSSAIIRLKFVARLLPGFHFFDF